MTWLYDLLRTPSYFGDDPWAFARNQAGHMAVGMGLTFLIGPVIPLVGYVLWEMMQVRQFDGRRWDSIEDLANVAFGVAFAATLNVLFLFFFGLYLASGILRRIEDPFP